MVKRCQPKAIISFSSTVGLVSCKPTPFQPFISHFHPPPPTPAVHLTEKAKLSRWGAPHTQQTTAGHPHCLHTSRRQQGTPTAYTPADDSRAPPLLTHQQTTAGHPHCLHTESVAGFAGRVAPCGRRHELLLLWGPSFLH